MTVTTSTAAGKSYTAAPGASAPAPVPATANEAPAPNNTNVNVSALNNKRWRQRKKLKVQQVKEELANAELEREQLKQEQTRLREKLTTVLLNNHQHQHHISVPSLFFAQAHAASASYAYVPGQLSAAPITVDQAANSMLRSYRQQRKQEDQRNMSLASAIVAQEQRIFKNSYMVKSNYQQYPGHAPSATSVGPFNLVAAQDYRAAAAAQPLGRGSDNLYTRQCMAPQQQPQLTNKSTILATSPPRITIAPSKKKVKTMSAVLAKKKTAKEQNVNGIKMLQPPRKPLSAYNFFFQEERAKLLGQEVIEEEHDDPRERKKRRHRKAHGKIGFTQLAKHVGQVWRTLDAETRTSYDVKCQEAKKKHAAELEEYEAQLGKMIQFAQVKKALMTLKAQEAERRNRNTVEEAKLLELQDTYRKRKAALEEHQH
jgi:hypothetical protein